MPWRSSAWLRWRPRGSPREEAGAAASSWLLRHQTGSQDQAQRIAVEEAERFEPRFGKATPEQITVWGGLLVCGAVAAARDDKPDEADDLLNPADYQRLRDLPPVVVQLR